MISLSRRRVAVADFIELTKPRIVMMVMVTAAAGFWLAGPSANQVMVHFHLLLGTMLIAGGTNALNQIAERDVDALMHRTQGRPLPSARIDPATATLFAGALGLGGALYLATFVNLVTATLAVATLVTYAMVYTPLKRSTSLATLVGGIPGALPVVGGWTAVTGRIDLVAIVLFWILFLWQLPHFLALGWLYREDYDRAGLKMLSGNDPDGRITFAHATLYAAALVPVSLLPTLLGLVDAMYFAAALILSSGFLAVSLGALRRATPPKARRLFHYSLLYLPALLFVMVLDRAL